MHCGIGRSVILCFLLQFILKLVAKYMADARSVNGEAYPAVVVALGHCDVIR